jgi:hypothetical protein
MERLDDARGIIDHLRAIGSPVTPPAKNLFREPAQREFLLSGLRRAAGEVFDGDHRLAATLASRVNESYPPN